MTDAELARALERGELPNDGFHRADHLRVALAYLNESPSVDEAVERMASTLRRFAAAVGKAEKYSQPVTEFWMYQMAAARAMLPAADAAALVRAYPRLLDKDLIHAAATRAADSSSDSPDRVVSRRAS